MTVKTRINNLEKRAKPKPETEVKVYTEILGKPGRFTCEGKEYNQADIDALPETEGVKTINFIVIYKDVKPRREGD
jgi:hypothetical protein